MNDDEANLNARDADVPAIDLWIETLLRSSAAEALEPTPPAVHQAASTEIRRRRRRRIRRRSLIGLAAAAVVAAIVAAPEGSRPRNEGSLEGLARPQVAHRSAPPETVPDPSPGPSLQGRGIFIASGDAIAVEFTSSSPEVTVVQLHPTTIAQRRARSELALRQLLTAEPNGG